MSEAIRFQKWAAQLGLCSRREAEQWVRAGRVIVNGKKQLEPGFKVVPEEDEIRLDGRLMSSAVPPKVYWLLHKPRRILTARNDPHERDTIYDLPKLQKLGFLVNPVGRLDYDSEGLLLLTNDGDLANRLMHPRYKVPRHYHVKVRNRLSPQDEEALRQGVKLEDGVTLPAKLRYAHGERVGKQQYSWYFMTVYEGRNRLVRRSFKRLGFDVTRLVRYGFGDLRMPDDLAPGSYLQLTKEQIRVLRHSAELI